MARQHDLGGEQAGGFDRVFQAHGEHIADRQDGGIQDIPDMVRLLTFFDPDDNSLMFYQDLQNG